MLEWAYRVAVLTLALMASGCGSARFPLCPKIAALSYEGGQAGVAVNRYLLEQATVRRVKISTISPFAARLSGPKHSLAWIQRDYAFMLCAFDPKQIITDEQIHSVCMSHAPEWVRIVRSKPEVLLLADTHFADTCVK